MVGVPIRHWTTWYKIETEDITYILAWRDKKKPLNVTLHGRTKIWVDGSDAHVLDDGGKDVKLPIVEKRARQTTP